MSGIPRLQQRTSESSQLPFPEAKRINVTIDSIEQEIQGLHFQLEELQRETSLNIQELDNLMVCLHSLYESMYILTIRYGEVKVI